MIEESIVPAHIAVIMDGNGRWGEARGVGRSGGHRAGVQAVEPIVRACDEIGVGALTLYVLSTENWKRPKAEVDVLLELMREFFTAKIGTLASMGVRVRVLGERDGLPFAQRALIESAERMTARGKGLRLNMAFNYGSRREILHAARALARRAKDGSIDPDAIGEEDLEGELFTAGLPPVDLLIRTGGEVRVSNFLLYQIAYAEMSFIKELWPDFTPEVLMREIEKYRGRDRRFGGVGKREPT